MKTVLIIDEDRLFLAYISECTSERCTDLEVVTCDNRYRGLAAIHSDIDLLGLEMPGIDGRKLLNYAQSKGINRSRIIILSGHDADYLHDCISIGECLAVMNKHDVRQKAVLDMIFDSLQQESVDA